MEHQALAPFDLHQQGVPAIFSKDQTGCIEGFG
jgi:hypothetical protein